MGVVITVLPGSWATSRRAGHTRRPAAPARHVTGARTQRGRSVARRRGTGAHGTRSRLTSWIVGLGGSGQRRILRDRATKSHDRLLQLHRPPVGGQLVPVEPTPVGLALAQ